MPRILLVLASTSESSKTDANKNFNNTVQYAVNTVQYSTADSTKCNKTSKTHHVTLAENK